MSILLGRTVSNYFRPQHRFFSKTATMAATLGSADYVDYPFLRHCEKETAEPVTGIVQGTIPTWLKGELVRVGPGIQKVGADEYRHMFDGLAILHKFQVKDGKAHYQSRALKSDAYKKNMEANRIVVNEFGTFAHPDPCQTIFGRLKADFTSLASTILKKPADREITDNCCVNVGYYGDQLYAMTETNYVRRVDPATLETLGDKTKIGKYVAVNSATAHPHTLPDGTVINVGNNYHHKKGPHYCFISVPPSYNSEETSFAKAKLIAEIPSRWKMHIAYFHSFGITDSGKLIFVEYPYCINLMGLVAGSFMSRSYNEWTTWYPNEKTRFYVVSMEDGKVHPVVYETDHLFTFHHINAYEENGEIVVDVAGYSDGAWVNHITKPDTRKPGNFSANPSARRYVLPLNVEGSKPGENLIKSETSATATLRTENVVDITPHHFTEGMMELPRINYKYNGKNYRYFYGLGNKTVAQTYEFPMDVLTKVDAVSGDKLSWFADDGYLISEPVFVPDSSKQNPAEDDGVLLAALLSKENPRAISLLVINAKDMTETGRVDFTAQGTVTGTFHGQWAGTGEKVHLY